MGRKDMGIASLTSILGPELLFRSQQEIEFGLAEVRKQYPASMIHHTSKVRL